MSIAVKAPSSLARCPALYTDFFSLRSTGRRAHPMNLAPVYLSIGNAGPNAGSPRTPIFGLAAIVPGELPMDCGEQSRVGGPSYTRPTLDSAFQCRTRGARPSERGAAKQVRSPPWRALRLCVSLAHHSENCCGSRFPGGQNAGNGLEARLSHKENLKSQLTMLPPLRKYNVNTMHGRWTYGEIVRGV